MKCKVLHESKGRLRARMACGYMRLADADVLEYYLRNIPGVWEVKVYDRTCDAVVQYRGGAETRGEILRALAAYDLAEAAEAGLVPEHTSRALNREFQDKLVFTIAKRCVIKVIFPVPLRTAMTFWRSAGYIKNGLRTLWKRELTVDVLDATAITVSMLQGNFDTASSVMFMLRLGEILEEWTHKKSVADLAGAMSLQVDKVWIRDGEQEVLVPIGEVKAGNLMVVRMGNVIPLDGKVVSGEMTVNQASITGESLPVRKEAGSYVYAGTVAEEGQCVVCVEKTMGTGRYDKIINMIEESEKLKSETENKASDLADKLIPYTLGGTVLTYALTRNMTKALAVLMVDFSCALKLSMPIAVLSAMRESSLYHISVKGGKFMEAVAQADTIVFDKTGTLTYAAPKVADIITFGGKNKDDMLRLAACLEEHYPHSMANAVVNEAKARGLSHEEYHSKVEYVVAHGIQSTVEGQKVVIGSEHFVFEDEGCTVPEGEESKFHALSGEHSYLYLAISGVLAAVICISDPLRTEAKDAIQALHDCGIRNVVMMTGDNRHTAAAIAKEVGVDAFYAEVLPEDKANYIRQARAAGQCVIMIGDGVNDSPALSEADAGIAINSGAAIAREIADITISSENLFEIVVLRRLSMALMKRIHSNYRFIVAFNLMLIGCGVAGVMQPTTSALLHNMSTLGISLKSMTNLLDEPEELK